MALALCLTLLPTAALAAELGPVDGTSAVETAGADADAEAEAAAKAEAEAKAKADAEAAAAVQAQIDKLPSLGELKGMDSDTLNEAYMAVQSAYDAYEALSEEQQAQVTGADCFEELFGWFNSQVAPLADKVTGIWFDGVDLKTGEMTQGTQTWEAVPLENTSKDLILTGGNTYMVGENQTVTIDGDLTMAGNSRNYLILFNGAKLIINGALILEQNELSIYSHTASQDLDTIGQITINNSENPTGAAIRSSAGSALTLNLCGGKLTAKANGDYGAVSNVYLNRNDRPLKATLGGELLSPADWAVTTAPVNFSENKDLVIEWCEHEDNEKLSYVDNKDNATHHMKCDLCGFEWLAANGASDNYSKIDHICIYTDLGDNGHEGTCVECKAVIEEEHSGSSSTGITITSDNRQHITGGCDKCGHGGTVENHTYNDSGECEVCGFTPVATTVVDDSGKDTGKLYESIEDAIKSGVKELWLVSYEKDPATDKYTNTLRKTLEIEAGVTLTLHMNGVKLEGTAGSPALTVSGGTLTVQGEADLVSQNITASSENPAPAIEVTGGSLVFEGDLTAQGGKSRNDDRQPAVKATGGTVEFKGALNLDGGLFLDSCERLASKLTQGRFYSDNNDQGQVYRVQIKDDYQHSYDLLADGYAFAEYDAATGKAKVDGNGNPVLVDAKLSSLRKNTDVIIVAHTHSIEEGQSACACGKQFEASVTADDGTITYYETIDEAFANVKANETVKLMIDSDDRSRFNTIYVIGGPYTFDLNGHRVGHRMGDDFKQAVLQVGAPDGNLGTLTVLDSSDAQTGYFYELELYNGSLTVESGSFYRYWESAPTATGTMTFKGGTVDEFYATSANVETRLYGGTFGNVYNNIGGKPGDLLADNRAFFNRGNDSFVNGYDYQAVRDVVVKDHTHHIVDGSCECGFTCAHDWSKKNGVCPICGYHCPHNAGATETGGLYACDVCGQTVTAMVTAPNGAITYYADGYVGNNPKSGLYFAIKAAKSGSTVTMLGGGCMASGYVTGKKTLTLDMSNGKTIDGILYVGEVVEEKNDTGNTLIVRGSSEISCVIVDPGNNLDLTGWTGKIGSLTVLNGGNATLNGGTFEKLTVRGAAAGSLLDSGYALQYVDSGAYVECSSTDNMENVRVVKCPHSDVTPKGDLTGVKCKYCGADFAATLDDAPYDTIDAAVSAWLQKGGTLKLYADYTTADGTWSIGSGSHTINLNKHRMSVQDGGAFKPTNNMHLTVIDGTEIGQIENILLDGGSFTMESGYVGNLKMTGGAVVALKGGSVDELDVQNCSANTNLSIQGGSLGKLNIEDWAEGMHVSATGGSLGAYDLPSGKILADVLDHQYYAKGTSLDRQVDTAQKPETFDITKAPYDFGSTSKTAAVPINGRIPFMVDSPSGNVGVYDVKWYRRTNSGAVHMTENRVAGVNVDDMLDVFCVITGVDRPGGEMQWQVAVKDYTINVVPAKLNGATVTLDQDSFVFDGASHTPEVTSVTLDNKTLTNDDYTVSGDTGIDAGDYKLIVTGKGNYTGKVEIPWTIQPHTIGAPVSGSTLTVTKTYDGTSALPAAGLTESSVTFKSEAKIDSISEVTLKQGEDFTISGSYVGDNVNVGTHSAKITITLKNTNYTFDKNTSAGTMADGKITKADAGTAKPYGLYVVNNLEREYLIDPAELLPTLDKNCEFGAIDYAWSHDSALDTYYGSDFANGVGTTIENGKILLWLKVPAVENDAEKLIGNVTYTAKTQNYGNITLTVNVNATNKIVPTGTPTLSKTTLAWGEQLSTITLSGTMTDPTDSTKTVKGKFEWVAPGAAKETIGEYQAEWKFTPTDAVVYAETSGKVTITVTKATPTGAPKYTAINASGKTLKDADLTVGTIQPEGTIQWELVDTTVVTANTAYKWVFTPKDTEHYDVLTGSITLYSVSGSSGGGGGSSSDRDTSSSGTVKTETTKNNDGSVTKTETKKDGTKVETTTGKDGSVSKTTTNPNGSSVTENKAADGSTGTVKIDKNGQIEAKTALSNKAVEDAKKSGEPVKAPVEVEASRNSSTAPTVSIELPKGAGETKVEIPVSNVKPGTVAVLVHPDGTEEILKASVPTENGIRLTVDGNATVKIVDNSKDFVDTRAHWAKDAIDFVSARELVNGISATRYAPDATATRAQLWTILARQNDTDLSGGANWYEKAQLWSKDKGISDGTNPNGTINRAQMVTMLWRTMGQPAAGGSASFADVPADSYYAQAVAWAIENGITAGVGGGRFDPNSTCTRAQIATFLARSMK